MTNSTDRQLVLGLDIDGVLADYEAGFRTEVAKLLGIDPSTIGPQTQWSLVNSGWPIQTEQHFADLHSAAVRGGMFRRLAMIEGASDAVWTLSDAGVHIRIVTHRLGFKGTHGIAAKDTAEWLDLANIPYRDLTFVADKPAVGAHVYIDDAPHNIVKLRAAGAHAIIFDQPYNQGLEGARARGWGEAVDLIEAYAIEHGLTFDRTAPRSKRAVVTAL